MSIINPMLTVRPVTPSPHTATPTEGRHYGLQPGQLVTATVTEGGHNEVLLELAQQRMRAQTHIPLQTGQKLRLLVAENHPQLKLRLFQDGLLERLTHTVHLLESRSDLSATLQQMAAGLEGEKQKGATLAKLLDFFTPFRSSSPESLSGRHLQSLARHLGLTLEADLARDDSTVEPANLKSLLLASRSSEAGTADEPKHTEQLLQKLELLQLCNLRLARDGASMLPLPLPFLDNGYLVAEGDAGSGQDRAPVRKISLYLSLQGLGEVRVDLLQEPQGLFVRFTCNSEDQSRFLAEQEPELRKLLTALPLCGATYSNAQGTLRTDLIRRILSEGDELLDERV